MESAALRGSRHATVYTVQNTLSCWLFDRGWLLLQRL